MNDPSCGGDLYAPSLTTNANFNIRPCNVCLHVAFASIIMNNVVQFTAIVAPGGVKCLSMA